MKGAIVSLGRFVASAAVLASSWLLTGCGGGEGGVATPQTPPVAAPTGRDMFLLFPNPQHAPAVPAFNTSASPPIDSLDYASAYYAAIDPQNEKDTLAKWKVANGFGSTAGSEVTVAFGDTRDLGYGRRMTGRISADGRSVAFVVENYQVDPGGAYGYSPLSLEAAAREDTRWRILINAIEWSPGRNGGASFVKVFNFDPVTGKRSLKVNLDGRGDKFMPGPCLTCHGGRGDALVPDPNANGKLRFQLVHNAVSGTVGDTQARMAPLEVGHFDFSPLAGFTRAEQEQKLKTMNMFVLCTYPFAPGAKPLVPATLCTRRPADASEWEGTAAELLHNAYGGDTLPSTRYEDTFLPADWSQEQDLYKKVVVPSCRSCHILRGVKSQSDIDLMSLEKFEGYAKQNPQATPPNAHLDDRIKVHVFERLDMPLAKIVFDTFWGSDNPPILARFLERRGFDLSGAIGTPPLRPIANPGPDRVIPLSPPTKLSADQSLGAIDFQWAVVSGPNGASLTDDRSPTPTFTATQIGTYKVRLVASNGTAQSSAASVTLKVEDPGRTATFSEVSAILLASCGSCHRPGGSGSPPVFFADTLANTTVARTDIPALHAEVRSRVNFADIAASPLLRKPTGLHHSGGPLPNFDDTKEVGRPERKDYDTFVAWILAGAPGTP